MIEFKKGVPYIQCSQVAHSRADTSYETSYDRGLMDFGAHDLDDLKAKDPMKLTEQEKVVLSLAYDAESRRIKGRNDRALGKYSRRQNFKKRIGFFLINWYG